MNDELSTTSGGLRKRLDEAEVLHAVVLQLGKDLNVDDLPLPDVGDAAFERLRSGVLAHLDKWQRGGSPAFSRAINRVDLTESMVRVATDRGGLHELAGVMVVRCLQKVLLRKHFAARG